MIDYLTGSIDPFYWRRVYEPFNFATCDEALIPGLTPQQTLEKLT